MCIKSHLCVKRALSAADIWNGLHEENLIPDSVTFSVQESNTKLIMKWKHLLTKSGLPLGEFEIVWILFIGYVHL